MTATYDDSRFFCPDAITLYANTNEAYLRLPVKGIIVELPGLGGGSCLGGSMERGDYSAEHAREYGQKGIVMAYMFPGPWSWGNAGAVRMTDGVIDALMAKYALPADTPIVISGGSMGGMGALNFAAYTRHALGGVAAACPCVDVLACMHCRADFPRTYISAVAGYDMPLEEALKSISPVELVDRMPDVPYCISSDGADELFPEKQCHDYVQALRGRGLRVDYLPQPGLTHGGFLPEVWQAMHAFMEKCILGETI